MFCSVLDLVVGSMVIQILPVREVSCSTEACRKKVGSFASPMQTVKVLRVAWLGAPLSCFAAPYCGYAGNWWFRRFSGKAHRTNWVLLALQWQLHKMKSESDDA